MQFKAYQQKRLHFNRDRLPHVENYFAQNDIALIGRGEWRSCICPFHADKSPSLRVHVESGRFRCMVCGTSGCDVLSFHRKRLGIGFMQAVRDLGAHT